MLQDGENDDPGNNGINFSFQALALFRSGHREAAASKLEAALASIERMERKSERVESLLNRIGGGDRPQSSPWRKMNILGQIVLVMGTPALTIAAFVDVRYCT